MRSLALVSSVLVICKVFFALTDPLSITVVDPSEDSLALARKRLAEVSPAAPHTVNFSTSLDSLPRQLDLGLIVTPAHCRARLVEEIVVRHQVKSWVLEKVLAQSCIQLDHIEQALAGNSQVWVNTPRRLMSWHKAIRHQLLTAGPSPLKVVLSGGFWGLACNAIHFIDLVAWWTNTPVKSVIIPALEIGSRVSGMDLGKSWAALWCLMPTVVSRACCHPGSDPIQISVVSPKGGF